MKYRNKTPILSTIRLFYRYFQRKFISNQTIVVVSAGTSGPDETLRWASSGPRAVICPPLAYYTTHFTCICHSAQQTKQHTSNIRAAYYFHLAGKNQRWSNTNYFWLVMSAAHTDNECKKHSEENTATIICDILNHSQEKFVIEIKPMSWSNFFQKWTSKSNPDRKYPTGYPILSMLTRDDRIVFFYNSILSCFTKMISVSDPNPVLVEMRDGTGR